MRQTVLVKKKILTPKDPWLSLTDKDYETTCAYIMYILCREQVLSTWCNRTPPRFPPVAPALFSTYLMIRVVVWKGNIYHPVYSSPLTLILIFHLLVVREGNRWRVCKVIVNQLFPFRYAAASIQASFLLLSETLSSRRSKLSKRYYAVCPLRNVCLYPV